MFSSKVGNLAVIDTKEKLKALIDSSDYFLRGESSLSFWIGLKYVKNKWMWVNGQPLGDNFQNWATINKGDVSQNKQSCAAINLYSAIVTNSTADVRFFHI